MATYEPPWRKKTRPCPFYQQGRCLFSDSCNFLHNVKAKTSSEALAAGYTHYEFASQSVVAKQAATMDSPPCAPPVVTVHSPDSLRSPTRSPRLSGLLLALKDVIDPDQEGCDTSSEDSLGLKESSGLFDGYTLVEESRSRNFSKQDSGSSEESDTLVEGFSSFADHYRNSVDSANASDEDDDVDSIFDVSSSIFGSTSSLSEEDTQSTLRGVRHSRSSFSSAVPFPSTVDEEDPEAYNDVIRAPRDSLTSISFPPRNEIIPAPANMPPSPTPPPQPHEPPSDLLSPVSMSPAPLLPIFRDDLCRSSPHREDSIDSGYADSWTGPSPFLMSPPRSPSSTLDLLASPFGSPCARVLSPRLGPFIIRHPPPPTAGVDPMFSPRRSAFPMSAADAETVMPVPFDLRRDGEIDSVDDDPEDLNLSREFDEETPELSSMEDEDITINATAERSSTRPASCQVSGRGIDSNAQDGLLFPLPPSQSRSSPDSSLRLSQQDISYSIMTATLARRRRPASELTISAVTPDASFESSAGDSVLESILDADADEDVDVEPPEFLSSADPTLRQEDFSGTEQDTLEALYNSYSRPASPEEENGSPVLTEQCSSFLEESTEAQPELLNLNEDSLEGIFGVYSSLPKRSSNRSLAQSSPPSRPETPLGSDILASDNASAQAESVLTPTRESVSSAGLDSTSFGDSVETQQESLTFNEDSLDGIFDGLYSPHPTRRRSVPYGESSPSSRPRTPQVPPTPHNEESQTASALTPTTAPILGRRVFTPPLTRGRAGTIIATPADVARSLSSPHVGLGSPFREQSPASIRDKAKSPVQTFNPESDSQEIEISNSKVPFGFRRSFALSQAPSSSSNLGSNANNVTRSQSRPRIITDLPPEHTSDSETLQSGQRVFSPTQLTPSGSTSSKLRPLRLSTILGPISYASETASASSSLSTSNQFDSTKRASISSSASVSSGYSLSNNRLLSSARSSLIPAHTRNTLIPPHDTSCLFTSDCNHPYPQVLGESPQSAPAPHSQPWRSSFSHHPHDSRADRFSRRASSRLSEPALGYGDDDDDENEADLYDETIRRPVPRTAPVTRPASILESPFHAIATPRPTLMFAIASDDVEQVRRVLESGEAGPNDEVGPQSALAFTLTNDQLTHKMEIVKALLAYGADPSTLRSPASNPPRSSSVLGHYAADETPPSTPPPSTMPEDMDPATRYYIARADASHTRRTSALIHRSFFRPLTRVRYDLVGQDRALEQLFRVLSMHSQQLSVSPIVVLLCGPSGHGKSLLARKFGSILGVPTHTVNMTTLRSTHDLWKSYSMSPYEQPSTSTLAQFLTDNEGKRCVVVLDEIEKMENESALWSLLMPWELGRCSLEAGARHIDVRNVIWLGTSNIGHDLVFEHHSLRSNPDTLMTREEYVELMASLRPRVSSRLGASLLSRVTTVLPFVPFSLEEKMAIAAEAMYTLSGETVRTMSPHAMESMVKEALAGYIPAEGARSLYRAVASQLVDAI